MKKALGLIVVIMLCGCSTVNIPKYIPDTRPHKQTMYASFDQTLQATKSALQGGGWEIVDTTDPNVYEHSTILTEDGQEILIFTGVKAIPMFLGTRYARVNIYLRTLAQPNSTEVEVRYLTVNSIGFKTFNNFKHPLAAKNILNDIEKNLR